MSQHPIPVAARVAAFIRRHRLLAPGARVVAAVSGGSDSVALVRLLADLQAPVGHRLAGLAHVNHQLRAADSDRDEAFCRQLAVELRLPAFVTRIDIDRAGRSPEDAARTARHQALEEARVALGADLVALGHTRDDQAETVLLKLLRGAGLRGLSGIRPRADRLVRPLLDCGRDELRGWLSAGGFRWVEDATNDDTTVPRNRIRHIVLPALAGPSGHDVVTPLTRHAEIARAEDDLIDQLASRCFRDVVRADTKSVLIDVALTAEPLALQRRVLLTALRTARALYPGFEQVEAVRAVLNGEATSVEVGGPIVASRNASGGVLLVKRSRSTQPPVFCYELSVPGRVLVAELGFAVSAEARDLDHIDVRQGHSGAARQVALDAERLGAPLGVRSWRPGDAMRPLGLGGRKKLQDLFVDRKVPREARRRLPLVVNVRDEVVWAPGLAIHDAVRVTSDTKAVVVLKLTQVGGPA